MQPFLAHGRRHFTAWIKGSCIHPPDPRGCMTQDTSDDETASEDALRAKLVQLRQQHRDMDAAIDALELSGAADPLRIRRLKKMKLAIRDEIGFIEDQLVPDIIA